MKKIILLLHCVLFAIAAHAQSFRIDGVVSDDSGDPIIGATIAVKGTTTGAVSDKDGKFNLTAPGSGSIIVISCIGYKTVELKAVPRMSVVLKESTLEMEAVVVTGMVKQDKRLFTGVADRLVADDVKLSGMPDISRGLEGRSAGVIVQNVTGTFGTAPKIRIRGATSIYGSSKPLWVLDGVIIEDVAEVSADQLSSGDAVTLISSAIAGLNADDIESFTILKDGSATSIYGARAMAGVIVVTTKKGSADNLKLNYSGDYTYRFKPNYRNFNIMNSQDQMDVYKEMQSKGWINFSNTLRASTYGVYGKMYGLVNSIDPKTGEFVLANTPEAMNGYLREAEMRNTDWFDLLFNNTVMHNHSVSISSGTDKTTSYFSMSAMQDAGWTKQSSVSRYTLNGTSTYKITPKLNFIINGQGSYRNQKAPGSLRQDVNGVSGEIKRDFDINPYSFALNTSRTLDPYTNYVRNYAPFNILQELEDNYLELNVVDVKFKGEMKWNAAKGLDFSVLGAIKYATTSQQHFIKENSNQARAYREMGDATIIDNNPLLYKNPDFPNDWPVSVMEKGGFYNKKEYRMSGYDVRADVAWNTVYDDIHIINTYAGVEVNSVDRMADFSDGWGMQYDNGELPFFNYLAFKKLSEGNGQYYGLGNSFKRTAAFFAMATYSYKGRYSATGTLRYEGSNRLGKERSARWLPTWNVGLSWNVHQEEFFERYLSSAVSHLTLKTSYSLTATPAPEYISNAATVINSYNPWRPVASDGESGLRIDYPSNQDLTYEKKREFNIGLTMGLFENRINLDVDWYKRHCFDLLGMTPTQGVGGFGMKWGNIATMDVHGIEFTISTRNITGSNLSWTTDFTFSYNKNKITSLKSFTNMLSLTSGIGFAREGYPKAGLFSIPFAGLDIDGFPMFMIDGELVTKDNYGAINFQQNTGLDWLKYEGPSEPTITGGLGNILTYRNFRLNLFLTYSFGNKVRLDPVFSGSYSDQSAMTKDFKNRWAIPGDELRTDIPVIPDVSQTMRYGYINRGYNAYNYSTARIADGGFVRLKEVSLTYSMPKSVIKNWVVSDMSFKLQATNLMLLFADSKLNGQDPEFFRSGGVAVPLSPQVTFTLRVGF